MESDKLGVAIFGVGRWGVHLVRNFLQHPEIRVVAIADSSSERLNKLSQKFSLDNRVMLSTDWEAVMRVPQVEAVAIATPATTHYLLIATALKYGYHVLAEKPLALDWQDCLALCRLAEQQQRQLVVDHTYLFHPAVKQGKTIVQQDVLRELRYGYTARTHLGPVRQDVDVLWDLAIHDIAIFNYWLNATPSQVQAQGRVWLQPHSPNPAYFPQGLSDLVWLKLTYPNNFQVFIHLCWFNPDKQRRLCVVGSQGTLIFDELNTAAPLIVQQGQLEQDGQYYNPIGLQQQILEVKPIEPLQQVCDHFLTCIRENRVSPISSGWIGAQLVQILCALTESLNQNGEVISVTTLQP
jgi:predicted dehydrogenase